MTPTRTRSRGRRDSRSLAAREGAERRPVILASAAAVVILLIFASITTSPGRLVLAASQHFLLKYSGVFALIALTASVGMGLVATDRIILNPGHRVFAQAVHRAVSFGALAFLIIHIVLEMTAKRLGESPTLHVHVLDAFVPFLSQYRTLYMAEGTIASDVIVLLVATGIVRRRFTANGNAWKWRAIHYSSYAALILGVLHGLLAGRKAIGTYVYWSYGAVIALIALGVVARILATSLRSKGMVAAAAPASDRGATGPMQSIQARAAALGLMGQISGAMPPGGPAQAGGHTRALPALQAGDPGPAAPFPPQYRPAYGAAEEWPQVPQVVAAAPDPAAARRMPRYEPGYDGPPRYEGAPRRRKPEYDAAARQQPGYPYDDAPTAQWSARSARQPMPSQPPSGRPAPPHQADSRTGPQPVVNRSGSQTGPQPAYGTGPQPVVSRIGPQPVDRTGPRHAYGTGPQPACRPESGYGPDPRSRQQPEYRPEPRDGLDSRNGQGRRPDPRHSLDSRYGREPGYRPASRYGPDPGYRADPRYGREHYGPTAGPGPQSGYGPDPGYPAAPGRPQAGPGGPPPPARGGGDDQIQPGRPRRWRPAALRPDERTGPIPPVPPYGGDERR